MYTTVGRLPCNIRIGLGFQQSDPENYNIDKCTKVQDT
jgi:hypothetical protein